MHAPFSRRKGGMARGSVAIYECICGAMSGREIKFRLARRCLYLSQSEQWVHGM